MPELESQDLFHSTDTQDYGKEIKAVPKPELNIGVDTKDTIVQTMIEEGTTSRIDLSSIESLTNITENRNQVYALLDTMAQDPTISSVLELYASDITETNEQGKVMWVESSDGNIAKFVTYLLDVLNVDKHLYRWARNLCLYGDLYLKLFRKSEVKDIVFDKDKKPLENLNEDVNVKLFGKQDNYVHYIEMVANPAEMYELTKFGKTYAYIKAPGSLLTTPNPRQNIGPEAAYRYKFKKKDVDIYSATEFAHGCLDDSVSREEEEVSLFLDDASYDSDNTKYSYKTRKGQSIFYNVFKIWRLLMLMQNSVLLNRVTKSSLVRIFNIEIPDMAKESVGPYLQRIKQLFEQKSSIDSGNSMTEYTNPGPIENTVYIPTHNGQGAITMQEVGGNVDVNGLADLDYFTNQFFGALRVPKQYLGFTDGATGFNGGTALSLESSRYAKEIKRIQNILIQTMTDVINLFLLDRGLSSYVNKFQLRMQAPTTQEEIDRRDNTSSHIQIVSDVMNMVADVEDPTTKLKILKSMLSNAITNSEVIDLIQNEIEKLEAEGVEGETVEGEEDLSNLDMSEQGGDMDIDVDVNNMSSPGEPSQGPETTGSESGETVAPIENETTLPTPSELGVGDMSELGNQ